MYCLTSVHWQIFCTTYYDYTTSNPEFRFFSNNGKPKSYIRCYISNNFTNFQKFYTNLPSSLLFSFSSILSAFINIETNSTLSFTIRKQLRHNTSVASSGQF